MDDINVNFIIPKDLYNENACSEEMRLAFAACEQHSGGGLRPRWLHENDCTTFDGLTKKDVFVLTEFKGEFYEKVKPTKCLVIGPRCLLCCLTEGTPIPSGNSPVFTVAMRGLVVTASGLSKSQKDKLAERVHWMGGTCTPTLSDLTTHLVSNTVLSDKYIQAVDKGIPVMSESWVKDVWETSLSLNVNGASEQFSKHKLPPFANLEVTTSLLPKKEKLMVMKLVTENGGRFSGAYHSETNDILVLTRAGVGGEKYKAAMESSKAVVTPAWVRDSAARGVALPLAQYRVAGASTSSPLAQHTLPDMSLNFSRITNVRPPNNFVDETRSTEASLSVGRSKLSHDHAKKSDDDTLREIANAYENFNISEINKAGPIFDGFCIWVCGTGAWRERACACVSRGGGVRYDAAHARVTHAVAAGGGAARVVRAALPGVPVLSPLWLLRSVRARVALPPEQYLIDENEVATPRSTRKQKIELASPMSKRNLLLLRPPSQSLTPPPLEEPPATSAPSEAPEELVHYLSQNVMLEPPKEKTPERVIENGDDITACADLTEAMDDDVTEEKMVFQGLTLEVQGLDAEALREVGAEVRGAGGELAAAGKGGSHVLVPVRYDTAQLATRAEPITVFWINECLSEETLVPLKYYHRPVNVTEAGGECLRGVVACLSTYSGAERQFLEELAKLMGAETQVRFCRRTTESATASTHLLCPEATGQKYEGAVRWGLPAVTARWLLDCAAAGARLHEAPYLVGETKAPPLPPEPSTEPHVESVSPHMRPPPATPLAPRSRDGTPRVKQLQNEPPQEPRSAVSPGLQPPEASAAARRVSLPHSRDGTPKAKQLQNVVTDGEDMSPASRYIAMARQGLLGGDSQETPHRVSELRNQGSRDNDGIVTPPLDDALSTPNLMGLSPTTRRRLVAVKKGEMLSDPIPTPTDPFTKGPATPDSAFGAALRPGSGRLSPASRKRLWSVVHALPAQQHHPPRDNTTPLSEIHNRYLAQFHNDSPVQTDHSSNPRKLLLQEQSDTPPAKIARIAERQSANSSPYMDKKLETLRVSASASSAADSRQSLPPGVDAQLQRLDAALSTRVSPAPSRARRLRDSTTTSLDLEPVTRSESQPNTVGWDDSTPDIKLFMLPSYVKNREEVVATIRELGGAVSAAAGLDAGATHLLCAQPTRSQKLLGSVASGKWVLHPAYVARSRERGAFLPEEEFEWGNPLAQSVLSGVALSPAERELAGAAHRWRTGRARGLPPPYAGVCALLHVEPARRALLADMVRAGGGHALDIEPPYTSEALAPMTVCLWDGKRHPLSEADAAALRRRGAPVCLPQLLSHYLTSAEPPRPEDYCLPEFKLH